jgi:hypothetical protein
MKNLFEPEARKEVLKRLDKIAPDSKPKWGKMTADQMLWHVNRTMSYAMGEYPVPYRGNIFMKLFLKKMILGKMPFPKGKADAITEWKATGNYNIDEEKKRFKEYVDRYAQSSDKKVWPYSPLLGTFTGGNWARIDYKHIDHHFTQFGA